jgi:serine/threonine-protein kinase
MIDGRGQPRITDFGLAGLAAEIPLSDLRSGTPAYMSPEQKAGKDVTIRSDLYSLGLVLHEMFTGKARKDTQSSPSELVKDLDTAIERLILRCLEEDPKRRPASAFNLAMALPGGDPIAAALAAGETPSPEMVAASQEKEGFSPKAAWACFATIIALAGFVVVTGNMTEFLTRRAPLAHSGSVLEYKAREILTKLGYPDAPVSVAHGFACCNTNVLRSLQERPPADPDAVLASHQPAVLAFWYRQHRQEIMPALAPLGGRLDYTFPANTEPGMVRLRLDPAARLIAFQEMPDARDDVLTPPVEVSVLFLAAGLDPTRFRETTPSRELPPMVVDRRLAWTGTYGEGWTEEVRVEAAYWEGRPVYFRVMDDLSAGRGPIRTSRWLGLTAALIFLTTVFGSVIVAQRHVRLGRGDRRGAARVGAAAFLLIVASWAMSGPHVAQLGEVDLFISAASFALFGGGLLWALYMAVEPYVRRHWPDALISWTRILAGRARNPLVASHVLAGLCLEVAFVAGVGALWRVIQPQSVPRPLPFVASLQGGVAPLGALLLAAAQGLAYVVAFILIVVLLRLLVRKLWLADALGAVLMGSLLLPREAISQQADVVYGVYLVLNCWGLLWLLRRFGLLSAVVAIQWELILISQVPIDDNWGSWYVGWSLLPWGLLVGAATWALWVILSAQRTPSTESAAS